MSMTEIVAIAVISEQCRHSDFADAFLKIFYQTALNRTPASCEARSEVLPFSV